MYVSEYCGDKAAIYMQAFEHPTLKPAKVPSPEQITKIVVATARENFINNFAASIERDVHAKVNAYVERNGEHGSFATEVDKDDYESGMDDVAEAIVEPFMEHLSQDWLGRNTIDCNLWIDGAPNAFCKDIAAEIYKTLTFGRTDNQALANAGFTTDEVINAYNAWVSSQKETKPMSNSASPATAIAAKAAAHLGKDFNLMAVYEDLETIFNDDEEEFLQNAAASRIGINAADVKALQVAAIMLDSPVDDVLQMIRDVPTEDKPKRQSKAEKEAAKKALFAASLDPEALKALKAYSSMKETDIALSLGVAKSSFVNYVSGKTPFNPTQEQYTFMRETALTACNALRKSIAILDGETEWTPLE